LSDTIRIKRRVSGAAGPPATLANAELAYNENNNVLYYGKGNDGSDVATSIIAVGGSGAFAPISANGNVSNSGTPTAGQYARWVTATTLQGVASATVLSDIGAQPLDADLTALAALTGTNVIYYRSAANTWAAVTIGTGLTFSGGTLAATGGGGGISDAPSDGKVYGRKNAAWIDAWASPALTGDPQAPTPTAGDNDTSIATTAFVTTADNAVKTQLIGSASSGFDTLGEIENYIAANITPALGNKADIFSPTFTGDPKAPTPSTADNDTSIATTAYVKSNLANYQPLDADLTALAALTGTDTIYYRSGTDTWSPVVVSTGLAFSGGNLTATGGGGGTPGGSNTHVQFNNSGAFGGSANFIWNNGTGVLTVTGQIAINAGSATSILASGVVESAGFKQTGTLAVLGPGTSGNVALRPSGIASATGQLLVAASGAVTSAGPINLPADPTLALQAATKQMVDAKAPIGSEYVTSTADAALTNERVLTDSATVTWDRTTAGQIKANATGGGGGNVSNSGTPVAGQVAEWVTATTIAGVSTYAKLASPIFSGTPTGPTASVTTNSLQLATTAYVKANLASYQPFQIGTWNPNDLLAITLSGGNLIATLSTTGGVRAYCSVNTGKVYWECTVGTWANNNTGVGLALSSAALNTVATSTLGAALVYRTGSIFINNVNTGSSLGTRASGNIIGIAVDFDAKLIWLRVAPAGTWNGSGTADPATGTGGLSLSSLTQPFFPLFAGVLVNEACTANFGASAFSGSVPSGFYPGIPLINAPLGAEYITSTADATLTNERVLTDTATITWDRTTAGQIKANAAGGGGGFATVVVQTFTASGTYTPTASMKYCTIELVGGGGGGGGIGDTTGSVSGCAGGGGAGGYSRKTVSAATVGANQVVTIGVAGTAGAAGTGGSGGAGGQTSVGTLCIAKGGAGGIGWLGGAGGLAGGAGGIITGAVGDVVAAGAPGGGGTASAGYYCSTGCGGSSFFGGGAAAPGMAAAASTAGIAASNYGSGGSGAVGVNTATARTGGAGSAGYVIITEYI
jgi:hypothetical protein